MPRKRKSLEFIMRCNKCGKLQKKMKKKVMKIGKLMIAIKNVSVAEHMKWILREEDDWE